MRRLAARVRPADCWTAVVALLLLSPMRPGGFPLGRDMVFTPSQPLTADALGLGSGSPRAVPLDSLVALASRVLDGAIIGRAALLIALVGAGCGAWRLLPGRSNDAGGRPAVLAAVSTAGFAVWNPFVVERLALGQWALLWAYAALPWLVLAGRGIRAAGPPRSSAWAAAVLALAAGSITPTGGLLGCAVLLAVAGQRRARELGLLAAVLVLTQLPWLVPALTAPAGSTSDQGAVAAFASRSERSGGVLLSLLGLGGIWDAAATPSSRSGLLGYLTTGVVLVAVAVGLPLLLRAGRGWSGRYAAVSLAGLMVAALTVVPGGAALLRALVRTVPGAGLLRDGQKWLLPFVLLVALCLGMAVQRAAEIVPDLRLVALVVGLGLPLLLLPDAIGTVRPTVTPARYPAGWYRASAELRSSPAPGDVLSLPFSSYRAFPWVAATNVIDPVPRWLARTVVVQDRLVVDGHPLLGEDRRAAAVGAVLERDRGQPAALARDLAGAGIGWVWLETDTPGPGSPDLSGLRQVGAGEGITLFQVPGRITVVHRSSGRRALVLACDLMALTLLLCSLAALAVQGARACYTHR